MPLPFRFVAALFVPLALAACAPPARADDDPLAAGAEKAAVALREYVYARYGLVDVPPTGVDAAFVRLRTAREGLVTELRRLGLADEEMPKDGVETPLGPLIPPLRAYFETTSMLAFIPLPPGEDGVLLVRAREPRDVARRDMAGRAATYRVIAFGEVVIADRRRHAGGEAHLAPVVRTAGKTVYLDEEMALRTARTLVVAKVGEAAALAEKAQRGAKLTPEETKALLRHRALATPLLAGGAPAVAEAIAREEEVRVAALLAATEGRPPEALSEAAAMEQVACEAVLRGVVVGEPRYQLASALALTIAAKDDPAARGAARALAICAEGEPYALLPLSVAEVRARARSALAARPER